MEFIRKEKNYALVPLGVLALLPRLPQKSSMINETKLFTDSTQQIYHSETSIWLFSQSHIGLNYNEDYYLLFENTESVI